MTELPKNYDPRAIEEKWYRVWLEEGLFHSESSRGGTPYCIVIPPPNVTGILHMGHALNNTIQDILIRWKRMEGYNTVWVPGTDHAGIATQNVVERALQKEGKTRYDLGREAFVQRVWKWREEYGSTIVRQLKRIGASCDWQRERFTMDEGLSRAVMEVFIRLYEKGLIYRGDYIINWCPRCRTALSDEESEHEDLGGKLYYIRYPLKPPQKGHVVVATTRPETLLGDVAVAIHPRDPRYRWLVGQTLILPVLQRELRVVEDEFVDPEFGTGVVKVTPAHDPNDYQIALRHGLSPINVMNEDATMNDLAGPYAGMDRFACREAIVEDLKDAGLIEKIEDHDHAVGHCYRCHTMVEPRLSRQWFVRMKPLAQPAIEVVRQGRVRFIPERWEKVYLEWMENIRDWCISRQIWWGHRIPIFYCDDCSAEWAAREQPSECPKCRSRRIRQDEDVLDTWFSSWLWPFSVFGWPEDNPDLHFYYPTNTLVTASEIIFFWVARMIMAGLEFMGEIPFRDVYIHGTVRDETGLKMSKSLGNSIDPLEITERFSADALRFSLTMLTATGQDVFLSNSKFEIGRNFGTKVWNAARFLQMQTRGPASSDEAVFDPAALTADDRYVLARLTTTISESTAHLQRYRFNDYAKAIYDFLWHVFCDWYVEYAKTILYGQDDRARQRVLSVMHYVFSRALRLLHPLMPFLTEELWHAMGYAGLRERSGKPKYIVVADWPQAASADQLSAWRATPDIVNYVEGRNDLIRMGRTLRADYGVPPAARLRFVIRPAQPELVPLFEADRPVLAALLRAEEIVVDPNFVPTGVMPSSLNSVGTIFVSLAGHVDIARETERLRARLAEAESALEQVTAKLSDSEFRAKAPPEVIAQHEARQAELRERSEKLRSLLSMLNPSG